jgi:hypothetical protein
MMKIPIDNLGLLEISDGKEEISKFLRYVYRDTGSSSENSSIPHVLISFVKKIPEHTNDYIVDPHGKRSIVKFNPDYKTAKIILEKGFNPDHFVFNLLEPVLILCNGLGFSTVIPFHGASFVINEKGVLVVATSGLGKSTILLDIVLHHKGKFISDEIGWVKEGRLVSYARKFYIYRRNYQVFPELYNSSSPLLKIVHPLAESIISFSNILKRTSASAFHERLKKRLINPVLFAPKKIGEVCLNGWDVDHIIALNKGNNISDVQSLLIDNVIDLWDERTLFSTIDSNVKKIFFERIAHEVSQVLKHNTVSIVDVSEYRPISDLYHDISKILIS